MARLLASLLAAAAALGPGAALAGGGSPAAPAEDLAARYGFLSEELRQIKANAFYLVLDAAGSELQLRLEGMTVRRFPLQSALAGQSRLVGGGDAGWPAASFGLVSEVEEPDRVVIRPPGSEPKAEQAEGDGSAAPAPPPLAETLSAAREQALGSAPTVYRLHFDPPLDVVVRGEAGPSDWKSRMRRAWYHLTEGWAGLWRWARKEPVALRLTLYMSRDDARRLYLALEPEMRLLIDVPPEGGERQSATTSS